MKTNKEELVTDYLMFPADELFVLMRNDFLHQVSSIMMVGTLLDRRFCDPDKGITDEEFAVVRRTLCNSVEEMTTILAAVLECDRQRRQARP